MKRIVSLLVFGLAFSTVLLAQPSINIVIPEGDPPCTGESVCLDVVVADFTNILSTEYYIEWDSTVLQFTNTGAYNLPGLTAANFTTINAGRILLTWEFDDCTDPNSTAHTILADGTTIFEICFTALGNYGASSHVIIPTTGAPDLSTPFIRRKFGANTTASCQNIGIETGNVDTAFVGTCLRPFIIDISDEGGNEGDLVCIDFSVLGFDGLTGFQFPVVWDSTKAVFEDLIVPQNLPNFNEACCFGVPGMAAGVQEGSITISWSAPPPTNVTTIADSTLIFQLCLRLKDGTCASDFDVLIADQQPGQPFFQPQASNEFGGGFANIPISQFAGNVQVGECDPMGIELVANCGAPINLNDTICVAVEAGTNFTDVTELEFLMEWNASVLEYVGVQNVNLLNLAYPTNFVETNTSNGILGLVWDNFATDVAEGTILYEVCFEAVGLGGNSPISFINNDDDIATVSFGPNIGINPTNCEVSINQPAGVVIELTDNLEGRPGDTLCFDFPVNNFTDVESMSFSLVFEPNNIEFLLAGGIQNINLPGASAFNFGLLGVVNGQITFDWTGGPATLADGTSLFTLCFQIPNDAAPGTCDQLLLTDTPLEAEVITSTSNGENVGLTGIGGNFCILSPEGFYLEGAMVTGDLRDTICVPYLVSEFGDITDASFCLNWNPGTLELIDIVDQGQIPGLNISIAGSPVGSACFDFTAPGGLSLPDSANIFDLCFELLGPADTCYTVGVSDSPSSTVNTLNGPGSLLDIDGEICVNDKLFITTLDDLIVAESCAGAEDGCIQVLVSGGVGPYIYSWNTSPFQNTPKARFLPGGEIILTVIDQTGLLVRDTFIIPTLGGNLFANAGADRISSCDEDFPCVLVNAMVAEGDDIVYNWTATQGGAVCSSPNNSVLLGAGPGLFVIEVKDTTTGCFVTDTIRLLEPYYPPIGIDADAPAITCVDDMVELSVQNDSDTLQYTWTAPDLTILVDSDPDGTTVMASDSGYYVLTTEVISTGCISLDSILVDIDTIAPVAIAAPGMDTTFIGCEDMAMLEGFAGDDVTDLTVQWFNEGGMPAAAANDFDFETNVPGIYTFEVTNTVTGCTNSSTTVVSQNADVPSVTIPMDPIPAFNCTGDPVPLSVEVTNVSNPDLLTIAWIGDVNPATAADFNTTALSAGTYEVIVENTANNCISSAEITIGFDTVAPVVTIDPVDQLNCNNEDVIISSNVSPASGDYLYEWRYITGGIDLPGDLMDPTQLTVGVEGTYELVVTDTIRGCEALVQEILVEIDTAGTVFDVGFIASLNCEVDTVTVLTSVELPAGTFTVDWVTLNGALLPTIVDSVAVFTSDVLTSTGEYVVAVTNEINGCTTVDTLTSVVNVFLDEPTAILASDNEMINCLNSSVILDASGSTVGDTLTPISYQWNIITGGADGSLTNDSLLIEQGGVYQFVVTNEASLCADTVTATVMEDFEEPLAVAENEAISLVCTNNQGVLSALGSSEGQNFTYTWLELDPDSLDVLGVFAEGFMVPVTNPGVYQLVVTNDENGCVSMDNPVVVVDTNGAPPQIVFGTPAEPAIGLYNLDCVSPDTLLVTYFVSNDTLFDLGDLQFDWTNADIEVVQTGQLFSALIPLDGITGTETFNLMVVDQATGCEGENDFVIENIIEFPSAEIVADTDLTIGCDENPVQIDGSDSSTGDEFSYAWQNVDGEELATGITFDADTAGTYELVVTNTTNFCQDSTEVIVMLDTIGPSLVLDSIRSFTCDDIGQLLNISAGNSGSPADFMIDWVNQTGPSVSITGVANELTANVTGPGDFSVTLTSNSNLCDTTVFFTVPADTMPPTIMIGTPDMLACTGSTVDITTTINSGTQSIIWDGPGNVSPPNALNVNIDQAGTYTVTVIADNGCTNTATVDVEEDPNGNPDASLEASGDILSCGDTIILSYAGISLGDDFNYQYITVMGDGEAVPAMDSLSAEVSMGGDYQLVVTNELNGCSDTSEVLMIEMIELDPTTAQIDSAGCGDVAIVSASLPPDATGLWTGPIGVVFENPTSASTLVSGLGIGENNLVFTISYVGCPDYAADTVSVLPELAPIALDDELVLGATDMMGSINVIDNDELGGISEFTVNFTDPLLGDITTDSTGSFTYTLTNTLLQPASDEFSYEVCSKNCPELCAQAIVTVTINRDSVELVIPNGFTPNNDGMNDELVFDQLLTNPEDFEDNELIVFNRWGDIVFEAKPYNNDWRGTNQEGNDLPDGTYYYILRLNIGDGEILRGDVTIIR